MVAHAERRGRPPLTVGMPVFNGEAYLRIALDSILAQTFADFRLVISDNASTDATQEICHAYATADTRVDYEREDVNRGAAWNFNRVFQLAESPLFRWAAADDLLAPRCLEACIEAMRHAPPTVALIYPRTMMIDAAGDPVRELDDGLETRASSPSRRLHHVMMNVVYGNPMFGVVRSAALESTRLHGSYPSADWVLLAEIALAGEIWELPERLFLRREHRGMSRNAQPDPQELTAWLDPTARPVRDEHRRLFWEFQRAIAHADLPRQERLAAYGSFATAWTRRHSRIRRYSRDVLLRRKGVAPDDGAETQP